jgi:hypothetical protein
MFMSGRINFNMKHKKGVFFSTDALIAVILLLSFVLLIYPFINRPEYYSEIPADLLKSLSELKIGELNNSYVTSLINSGEISDMNKSVLEQIGEFYVKNITKAELLSQSVLNMLNPQENVGLWFGTDLLASKNKSSYESSHSIQSQTQMISGIQKGGNLTGFSSKAYLSKASATSYVYFGGYVGDGNLSINLSYEGQIKDLLLEIAINKEFDVYINNNYSGHYDKSTSEFIPARYNLNSYANRLKNGTNLIEFRGKNLYIAGGYMKATYNETVLYSKPEKYTFPGINGVINLYDGVYIPENLTSMNLYVHYSANNKTIFLNLGNKTVLNDTANGERKITINNSQLITMLNYNSISGQTLPIRMALAEIQTIYTNGNADVVLITDLSDSMDWKLNSDSSGIVRNCSDPYLYASNTSRVSLAKCLDKLFIDKILNTSGNRVALSAFYGDDSTPYKGRVYQENLGNNSAYLKGKVEAYNPQGGTCICCAINDAYEILNTQSNPNRKRFVLVMSDGIPTHSCEASSGCTGTRTGLQSKEGLWLGSAGCYGGTDDCETNDCSCASTNANWSSCRVNSLGATVYSVGFGPVSQCTMANSTLRNIANCGKGKYYSSNNATVLEEIYRDVAQEIVSLSFIEQISFVVGNISSRLYPDSFIVFNSTKKPNPFGLIVTTETPFSNAFGGSFFIPNDATILEAKVISYSGPRWTSRIFLNNQSAYSLDVFGQRFQPLGDPYSITLSNSLVQKWNNTLTLTTGLSPVDASAGSDKNKIIFTTLRNLSVLSHVAPNAEGCDWTIYFESGKNITLAIPPEYDGTKTCNYGIGGNLVYDNNDAIQSASYQLLLSLDPDKDLKVDVEFTDQDMQIDSFTISGIPYTWSTRVQARSWY